MFVYVGTCLIGYPVFGANVCMCTWLFAELWDWPSGCSAHLCFGTLRYGSLFDRASSCLGTCLLGGGGALLFGHLCLGICSVRASTCQTSLRLGTCKNEHMATLDKWTRPGTQSCVRVCVFVL